MYIKTLLYAFIMIFLCSLVDARVIYDYDVEWPKSSSKEGIHVLAITINSCKTLFNVKTEDLERFSNNNEELRKLIRIAIKRERLGCAGKQ